MNFSTDEKIAVFDKISQNYFNRNFGSMSKSDFETLLFSEYIEHCIKNNIKYDDYSISKELGITQTRVRSFKERKELKYPHKDFVWQIAFVSSVENAKYDEQNHRIKMIVQDVNVMIEVRNFIENEGWYDDCSLNKKLLSIPLDCFVEICYKNENFDNVFSDEIKKKIKSIAHTEDSALKALLEDFSKESLKSFLMSASKEIIPEVLGLLPFGGMAKKAFDFLLRAIEGVQ